MVEDDDKNKSRAELIFERDVARDVAECAMQSEQKLIAERDEIASRAEADTAKIMKLQEANTHLRMELERL